MVARLLAVAIVLAAFPSGRARADEEAPKEAPKEAGLREARGAVGEVDKDHNRVTVEQPKGPGLTLQVDRSTTIFIDGRTGTLDEVKAGSEVRASYEYRQGANRAQWIEISKKEKKSGQEKEKLPETPQAPQPAAKAPPPAP